MLFILGRMPHCHSRNTTQDVTMQVDNPQETMEAIKHGEIDESLYSRQL